MPRQRLAEGQCQWPCSALWMAVPCMMWSCWAWDTQLQSLGQRARAGQAPGHTWGWCRNGARAVNVCGRLGDWEMDADLLLISSDVFSGHRTVSLGFRSGLLRAYLPCSIPPSSPCAAGYGR